MDRTNSTVPYTKQFAKKTHVKSEDGTKVTNCGKGGYDVISSDKGFNEGIHKWTIKCLEIDLGAPVSIGVITKTDFKRKEGKYTSNCIYSKETGDGCLLFLPFLQLSGVLSQRKRKGAGHR